jgi:tRNA threonylcarbamoyladenosine biosynthesis protein TsaB
MSVLRILGIDTSGAVAAVALYDSTAGVLLGQQLVYTKRTHSQVILPLVERMLTDTGTCLEDVDRFAVAAGPGSYTGLRIGIAAVKAMSMAQGTLCCGISTLEALGWQAHLSGETTVCAVMKARKGLVYAGLYRFVGETCTALQAEALLPEETLWAQLQALSVPVLLTGDGAAAFLEAYPLPQAQLVPPMVRLQSGWGLCRGAVCHAGVTPDHLEAAYLQLVQAEKEKQERAGMPDAMQKK